MEFLIAGFAHELLLPLMLPGVTQPIVLPNKSLSASVASKSKKKKTESQKKRKKRFCSSSYGLMER